MASQISLVGKANACHVITKTGNVSTYASMHPRTTTDARKQPKHHYTTTLGNTPVYITTEDSHSYSLHSQPSVTFTPQVHIVPSVRDSGSAYPAQRRLFALALCSAQILRKPPSVLPGTSDDVKSAILNTMV